MDTICGVSTPPGRGGISIIRVSGNQALSIAQKVFQKKRPVSVQNLPSHTVHYGMVLFPDSKEVIDEAMLMVLRAPNTYTREDMVEIHCHGGSMPVKGALKALLSCGCRLAEPGEFTKRAFLNGRIDLTQAEAVMDVINSQSENEQRVAMSQLRGALLEEIRSIQSRIMKVLIPIEAALDFPDETMGGISTMGSPGSVPGDRGHRRVEDMDPFSKTILDSMAKIGHLLQSYNQGKVLREGIATAIVGRPNVGKSTLLNRFLGEERAIVTPHPGTTRDILDERVLMEGIPLRVLDMAGLRKTSDPIEQEGVRRARSAIEQADLVLLVLDGGEPLKEADLEITAATAHKHRIIVMNKCDPGERSRLEELSQTSPSDLKWLENHALDLTMAKSMPQSPVVQISALYNIGVEELKKQMAAYVREHLWNDQELGECLVTRERHQEALKKTQQDLGEFLSAANGLMPSDVQAFHLRSALDNLSEIIGTVTPDDILERIFSEFCIGK